MVNYLETFTQLGAEHRILRKTQALIDESLLVDTSTRSKRLLEAAYSDTVPEEFTAESKGAAFLVDTAAAAIRSFHAEQLTRMEATDGFFGVLDVELTTSSTDKSAGAIEYIYDPTLLEVGEVQINSKRGRYGALDKAMRQDGQTIQKNTITFSTLLTAFPGNIGTLVSSVTLSGVDHYLSGTTIFECVDETISAPKLTVQHSLARALPDGTTDIEADNQLTPGKLYGDGPTGLTKTKLNLGGIVEAGDGSAVISSMAITTPSDADSTVGKFFMTVAREAGDTWRIKIFKDSTLLTQVGDNIDNTIVPPAVIIPQGIVGSQEVTITCTNGSKLVFQFQKANAHAAFPAVGNGDSDINFDIKSPRVGDRWKIVVQNNEAGNFATKIAKVRRVSLPSSGAPTISDALASSISFS